MAKQATSRSLIDYTRSLGDGLLDAGRNVYLAGLGVYAVAEDETRNVFGQLVERGERFETDDKKPVRMATDGVRRIGRKVEEAVQQTVATTLRRAGVSSQEEIRSLTRRVEQLNRKLDRIAASG